MSTTGVDVATRASRRFGVADSEVSMTSRCASPRSRLSVSLAGLSVLVLVNACSATRLQSAWVKPDLQTLHLRRVVAIAITKNPARRRSMEASIAEQIRDAAPEVEVTESSSLI